ncbi:DUF421 domain-containing protein [Alkalibacillus salilacus]|uniref:Uncharacterized membrane protein YcaP (DUF421 family) n=1 Tax=Alkalibacillus salilacus TaxID=284582 RepID=A0ABT9VBJ3_9BACI|nr:DUF421 domain-containing protein [Alkalibacillus salilacus]MDQ0158347.1 uncharacterized membrane protein YcaP (DUF421 family) [Alkalibacillus salilacus]
MDFNFIWKAILVVVGGILILRLAGRKSISQLTVAQTVMMIAIGSLIIQPVGDRSIGITMVSTILMVGTLLLVEYIVLKSDALETFVYGKSLIVVENGQVNESNLKKLRLTVDMLEMRMRQQNIQHISDVQWATIEPNGQLGYMLKTDNQYATKQDIQMLKSLIESNQPQPQNANSATQTNTPDNIFTEVKDRKHKQQPKKNLD